ncbi:MAG: ROK family protein [Anaeromyxobacter sp.]|nr:ROK family protein [Anaeromyxobacter sp.]MBL0278141.1 ROK family protein [Anaeromyxobacter sp.]
MTARLRLGVDLGGTNARAALVDQATGEVVASHKLRHQEREPAAVARTVAAAVAEAARQAGVAVAALGGAGVGVAGQCLGSTGVVLNAPNLGWREVAFGALLAAELRLPVRIANDLSVAAWGERAFGAARGVDDAVLAFVGSGVGAGLILGGRLHDGASGVAGELGHIKVAPRGAAPRQCGCGEWGCLEAYVGGMNLAARVREDLAEGKGAAVLAAAGGDPSKVSASAVEAAYTGGDPYARELWSEAGELLGTALANLCTLLNPARLVLGGGVLLGCPHLLRISHAHLHDRTLRAARGALVVVPAGLGDDAGVVGAALLGPGVC